MTISQKLLLLILRTRKSYLRIRLNSKGYIYVSKATFINKQLPRFLASRYLEYSKTPFLKSESLKSECYVCWKPGYIGSEFWIKSTITTSIHLKPDISKSRNWICHLKPDPGITCEISKLYNFKKCDPHIGIYRYKDIHYKEDTYTFIFWKGEFQYLIEKCGKLVTICLECLNEYH